MDYKILARCFVLEVFENPLSYREVIRKCQDNNRSYKEAGLGHYRWIPIKCESGYNIALVMNNDDTDLVVIDEVLGYKDEIERYASNMSKVLGVKVVVEPIYES